MKYARESGPELSFQTDEYQNYDKRLQPLCDLAPCEKLLPQPLDW
jgi:hypothetical protein